MVTCDAAGNVTDVRPNYTCKTGYFTVPAPKYCQGMPPWSLKVNCGPFAGLEC
jgi:hypothetical protein